MTTTSIILTKNIVGGSTIQTNVLFSTFHLNKNLLTQPEYPYPMQSIFEYIYRFRLNDDNCVVEGVAIGSVGVIIIGLIVILLRNKRRYKPLGSQNQSRSIESDNNHSKSNQSDNTHSNAILESRNIYFGVPVFSYDELEEATNRFDQSKELGSGSGGFGTKDSMSK
ncbi:hypothetical protein K1719_008899 [Acacia pycnantha]|nr:hypothetical protein K1719_008899 [Acacia pycnantha]